MWTLLVYLVFPESSYAISEYIFYHYKELHYVYSLVEFPIFLEWESGADYWDAKTSPEDMEEMWNNPEVAKEWTKSGEKRGKVRFSHDAKKKPYLSRVELKA